MNELYHCHYDLDNYSRRKDEDNYSYIILDYLIPIGNLILAILPLLANPDLDALAWSVTDCLPRDF